ncbi:hypothetical protein WJX73_004761 [Symbiochloris irregularis]|uniref:Uncharacterized protein n=1 Tax=Symbiochloris irregularis TaxID=706552 RepID=A0AAW1PD85_9CHLO
MSFIFKGLSGPPKKKSRITRGSSNEEKDRAQSTQARDDRRRRRSSLGAGKNLARLPRGPLQPTRPAVNLAQPPCPAVPAAEGQENEDPAGASQAARPQLATAPAAEKVPRGPDIMEEDSPASPAAEQGSQHPDHPAEAPEQVAPQPREPTYEEFPALWPDEDPAGASQAARPQQETAPAAEQQPTAEELPARVSQEPAASSPEDEEIIDGELLAIEELRAWWPENSPRRPSHFPPIRWPFKSCLHTLMHRWMTLAITVAAHLADILQPAKSFNHERS